MNKSLSRWRFGIVLVLFLPLLLILLSCRKRTPSAPHLPKLPPPDLSECTRVELRFQPSLIEYCIPHIRNNNLLSPEEIESVNSLEPIVVNHKKRINVLAHDVEQAVYSGPVEGLPAFRGSINVVCYHNDERLTSFSMIGYGIMTQDRHWFKCDKIFASLAKLAPHLESVLRPFELRVDCGRHLNILWSHLTDPVSGMAYPDQSEWCDVIVPRYRSLRKIFKCPSAGEGKCHYALNPDCKSNSPPDTVLLFETKAGWNQHGGPELFTFDNHEPKGGCVLLNDGTVKFIRTEEELAQLRWK